VGEPPRLVARFTHVTGAVIEVVHGDVRDLEVDVLLLGRAPALRRELAASCGRALQPWPWAPELPWRGRPPTVLDVSRAGLTWRRSGASSSPQERGATSR
jgi:hypothetical protein